MAAGRAAAHPRSRSSNTSCATAIPSHGLTSSSSTAWLIPPPPAGGALSTGCHCTPGVIGRSTAPASGRGGGREPRREIAGAPRQLFAERGYVATTIAAISDRADIPLQTVYSALGSKARILQEVTRLAIEPLAVTETWEQAAAAT